MARACVFKRVCVICALMCNYLEFDVAVGEALDAVLPVLVGAQIDDVTIRVLVPGGEKKCSQRKTKKTKRTNDN